MARESILRRRAREGVAFILGVSIVAAAAEAAWHEPVQDGDILTAALINDMKAKLEELDQRGPLGFSECITVQSGISECRGLATAICPAGYTLTGGGHQHDTSCDGSEASRLLVQSYPGDNAWHTSMEFSTVIAFARCCR